MINAVVPIPPPGSTPPFSTTVRPEEIPAWSNCYAIAGAVALAGGILYGGMWFSAMPPEFGWPAGAVYWYMVSAWCRCKAARLWLDEEGRRDYQRLIG